ncbi:MAG: hypothetical protein J3K34DRAFT_281660 [Monoraphidium minutum]|nr:MAG: hypothetical protein J3K34DRAFT_281660 [Monoraphidium minutum]
MISTRCQGARCPFDSRQRLVHSLAGSARNQCTSRGQPVVRAGEGLFGKLFGGSKQVDAQQQPGAAPAEPQQPAQQQQPVRGVEFPPFQTVSKGPAYDLRFYEPYAVVEMDYRRRESGYLTLGQYQDGANADRAAFVVTQPVVMTYHPDGRKTMAMMVGSRRAGGGGARRGAALPGVHHARGGRRGAAAAAGGARA